MARVNDNFARRRAVSKTPYQAIPRKYWRTPTPRFNPKKDKRPRYVSHIDDPKFWVTRREGAPYMWFHKKQDAQDLAFLKQMEDPDTKWDVMGV